MMACVIWAALSFLQPGRAFPERGPLFRDLESYRTQLEALWKEEQLILKADWDSAKEGLDSEWDRFEKREGQHLADLLTLDRLPFTLPSRKLDLLSAQPPLVTNPTVRTTPDSPLEKEVKAETLSPEWDIVQVIGSAILRYSRHYDVDPALVLSIIKAESNFHHESVSPKGAIGLMQLMPGTAAEVNSDPRKIEENIRGGILYLSRLKQEFQTLTHTIAAYNAGPAAVRKYQGIPPYRETREFVERVMRFYKGG